MNWKQAVDKLKNMRLFMKICDQKSENKFSEADYEANNMAVQALEKQVPMELEFEINFGDTLSQYKCKCGNKIKVKHDPGLTNNNNAPNYCSNCGQRIIL